jgi:hypothetical protein
MRDAQPAMEHAAKTAERVEKFSAARRDVNFAPRKSFLNSNEPRLTARPTELGTGVAKSAPLMPLTPTLDRPDAPAPAVPQGHVALESIATPAPREVPSLPDAAASPSPLEAHRAVEVVLHAAERVAAREQHAVKLEFSVAGEDLSVRVELRGADVQTTFHTDSPELRAALAHEWQALTGAADRAATRFADPVFSNTNGSFAANAESSADRRGSNPRDPHGANAVNGRAPVSISSAAGGASLGAAPARSSIAPRTSRHLHTLA